MDGKFSGHLGATDVYSEWIYCILNNWLYCVTWMPIANILDNNRCTIVSAKGWSSPQKRNNNNNNDNWLTDDRVYPIFTNRELSSWLYCNRPVENWPTLSDIIIIAGQAISTK